MSRENIKKKKELELIKEKAIIRGKTDFDVNKYLDCHRGYGSVPIFITEERAFLQFMNYNCREEQSPMLDGSLPVLHIKNENANYNIDNDNIDNETNESKEDMDHLDGGARPKSTNPKKGVDIEHERDVKKTKQEGVRKGKRTAEIEKRRFKLSETIYASRGTTIRGLSAPVSIVKVRKNAYETLVRSIISNATEVSNPSENPTSDGIYNIERPNPYIKIIYETKEYDFDICGPGKIFIGAEENDNSEEMVGGGLTRDNLNDANDDLRKLDRITLQIILLLYEICRGNNTNLRTKCFNILKDFIVVASGKEYLDIGQLYAIIKPTILENFENNWIHDSILAKAKNFINLNANQYILELSDNENRSEMPFSLPRKPMLETADGAATRIAANSYFTSYSSCKTDDSTSATFYIDHKNVSRLAMLFMPDFDELLEEQIKKEESNQDSWLLVQYVVNLIRETLQKEENQSNEGNIISLLYFILRYPGLEYFIDQFNSYNKNVFYIPRKIYYYISVTCFLFQTYQFNDENVLLDVIINKNSMDERINDILDNLINCNFDPLCHDNGRSGYYRIIMIVLFMLKNDIEEIAYELHEMSGINLIENNPEDEYKQKNIRITPSEEKKYDIEQKIIDFSNGFSSLEKNVFLYLAMNDYSMIEELLYYRLLKKSSYVFTVREKDVVIVDFKYSVTNAHESATTFSITELSSTLQPGVQLIPYYTNVAVDLKLKHDIGLTGHMWKIQDYNSQVWETAVTRVDAAAQKTTFSYRYDKPICMPIIVKNLIDSENQEPFTFSYNFVYGINQVKKLNDVCNDNDGVCKKYILLTDELSNTNFYLGKRDVVDIKRIAFPLLENVITNIRNNNDIENVEIRSHIATIFAKLIDNAICGPKPRKEECHKKKASGEEIINAKNSFIENMNRYMIGEDKDFVSFRGKLLINKSLEDILKFSKQKIEQLRIMTRANQKPQLVRQTFGDNLGTTPALSTFLKQRVLVPKGGRVSLTPESTLSITPDSIINSKSSEKDENRENSYEIINKNKKDIKKLNINVTNLKPLNKINVPALGSTYSTLFGKYGFYMVIDKNGEYVLKIINTPEEFDEYKRTYDKNNLQIRNVNTNVNTNENINLNENINSTNPNFGGKNKTKKLRKKTNNKFKKTKRHYKCRSKIQTRKKIINKKKRKTKKN